MTRPDFQRRAREHFGDLIDEEPVARERVLEELALEDPDLAAEVRSLLLAHASAGEFLRDPSALLVDRLQRVGESGDAPASPPRIDGFRLERALGRGNFGEVWLATQLEPFEREVAIKVLACARMSAAGRARFAHEIRALVRMEHPCVARVFGIGESQDGRPWFSMEVVRGAPLTAWCDRQRAPIADRVQLLERVCLAVHHAHQRGILHRDLKPNNVLVAECDGEPAPKLIDFGLSVPTSTEDDGPSAQRSLSLGTPLYMAPEQADTGAPVDTRTDVYGLGALLCELLVGEPPIDLATGERVSLEDLLASVQSLRRRTPSQILAGSSDVELLAVRRATTEAGLQRSIAGDLEAIVARATAFDPMDRYDTVIELARDLRAALERRPVRAREGGVGYRVRCLLRRRAPIATALSAVLVTASIGGGFALRGHLRSLRADEAARESAFASEEVNRLLQRLILAPHPDFNGRDVTMLEVLRAAEHELAQAPPDRPLTEARMRHALGCALLGLGDPERAEFELRRAVELLEALPPQPGHDLATGSRQLGHALIELGRPAEARDVLERELERTTRAERDTAVEFGLRLARGMALRDEGNVTAAVEEWNAVVDRGGARLGADHVDVLAARLLLSQVSAHREPPERIAADLEAVFDDYVEQFGDSHPKTQSARAVLGVLRERQGRTMEAEALFRQVLEARTVQLGEVHPTTLETTSSLASVLRLQGRTHSALELLRGSLAHLLDGLGAEHPSAIKTRSNIASLLAESGRLEDALDEFREVYELQRDTTGELHPDTLGSLANLANVLDLLGRGDEARPLHRRAYEGKLAVHGPEHPHTLISMANLASNLRVARDFDESRELTDRLIEVRTRLLGAGHPETTNARKYLGVLLYSSGQIEEGVDELVNAYRTSRAAMGPGHRQTQDLLRFVLQFLDQARLSEESEALRNEQEEALLSAAATPDARPETLLMAAKLQLREGELELALEWSQRAGAAPGFERYAAEVEALALARLGQESAAASLLDDVIREHGDLPDGTLARLLADYVAGSSEASSSPSER